MRSADPAPRDGNVDRRQRPPRRSSIRGSSITGTQVIGNSIGVHPALAGNLALGNAVDGIHNNGASTAMIGGAAATDANTMAGQRPKRRQVPQRQCEQRLGESPPAQQDLRQRQGHLRPAGRRHRPRLPRERAQPLARRVPRRAVRAARPGAAGDLHRRGRRTACVRRLHATVGRRRHVARLDDPDARSGDVPHGILQDRHRRSEHVPRA